MVVEIMRLIDADALIDELGISDEDIIFEGMLEDAPTIDAVPVVRCKDCKHWREGTSFSYCDKLYGMGVLDALDYMTAEDDYCSMAERRTDE